MTAWTEHVKAFAKSKGISYKDALKNPESSATYKASKGGGLMKPAVIVPKPPQLQKPNIEMVVEELPAKKGRGRPKKYTSEEEAKKAKTEKTMESNKRKKAEIQGEGMKIPKGFLIKRDKDKLPKVPEKKPIFKVPTVPDIRPIKVEGTGLNVGYSTENTNGLSHIYPISHEAVLQMLSCCR